MTQRRASQLAIAFSPIWKRQAVWDTPLDAADLTKSFPATSRNYIDIGDTTEDIDDCTGEDLLFELLTGREARLNVDMDFDPDTFAGIVAMAAGVASAPSGGTNEVQTETVSATGGSRTLTVQTGTNTQTTAPIAYNANAAAIQAALEALSNVGAGDIVVAGSGPYTYTFSAALQKQNVDPIVVNTHNLTGGSSTIVTTTPGVGRLHAISRLGNGQYTLPITTMYVGFRGSTEQPVIFKNVAVNSFRVRSASREKVTASIEFIGSGDLEFATGFTMPECQDILPIRFGDCKAKIAGTDYIAASLTREFEYYFQNNINPKFDGQGIYATRHERADKRPSQFNFWILGEPGDDLYDLANSRSAFDVELQLGPDGRCVNCIAPSALVKLAPTPIRFGGDPAESELAIQARPRKVIGDATTPSNYTANIATSATLIST